MKKPKIERLFRTRRFQTGGCDVTRLGRATRPSALLANYNLVSTTPPKTHDPPKMSLWVDKVRIQWLQPAEHKFLNCSPVCSIVLKPSTS